MSRDESLENIIRILSVHLFNVILLFRNKINELNFHEMPRNARTFKKHTSKRKCIKGNGISVIKLEKSLY